MTQTQLPAPISTTLCVALAQMRSANAHGPNIDTVGTLAAQAADRGAELLALPEVSGLMNRDFTSAKLQVVAAQNDPFIAACQGFAAHHQLWIHTGSTPVLAPDGRFLNHSTLIDNNGNICAAYDKIHLFDVALEGQTPIGESERFAPGDRAVLAQTPWGGWGMTICYDVRFAHLYRRYAQAAATIIFVPSAFTVPTGRAHWQVLLRARAIETGAFIVAAAQSGAHADGRKTWGHAMVVDPWGTVLTDMGDVAPAIDVIEIDLTAVIQARRQIPAWSLNRSYGWEVTPPPLT